MTDPNVIRPDQRRLLARFWASASGFWSGPSAWRVWLLCLSAIGIVIAQLAVQYQLNYWNRDFFDALEQRNHAALRYTILLFIPTRRSEHRACGRVGMGADDDPA